MSEPAVGTVGMPESRVFHTLDALRGFAAIGVVAFHMKPIFAPLAFPGGYLAVDLFFMMSGVVLSHAYESRFRAGMGVYGFMRARLIRLYPLYLLGALLGIAVTVASLHGHNSQNWSSSSLLQAAILALLLLPNISTQPVDQMFPLNIPCWSLFLEVVVNLLFVLMWPWLTLRRLIITTALSGAVVIVAILHAGSIDQGSVFATVPVGLARTIFGFSVGVRIARSIPAMRRSQNSVSVLLILGVVGASIMGSPHGAYRAIWDCVCVLLVFPAVVYLGTLIDPGPRLRGMATFLGVTSYAIYVLHSPLSSILNSAIRSLAVKNVAILDAPYLGIAVLAALMIGCWLVDRYFDLPVRSLLNRRIPKSPSKLPVS